MDKKAKKILFNTFWSSKGWKMDEERQITPEDFTYAKENGLMFDPITISHDECVKKVIELAGSITMEQVAKAFLCSLSTRRMDWRSAVTSYSIAKCFEEHEYAPEASGVWYVDGVPVPSKVTHCKVCKEMEYEVISREIYEEEDLNVLNFERLKWGGVGREALLYIFFDLEQFAKGETPEPTKEDIAIFKRILQVIDSCNPTDYPGALRDKLADVEGLKTNKNERFVMVEILACIGVLTPKSYNRPVAGKFDWTYATYWRGEDGYDKDVVEKYFGRYL
ncbi:MAG: hypothetical protein IJ379_11525 [Lachnospiraceae bacterium]|nr:hypothetical protein [Lachnospiraceae bacterium]